MKTGIVRTIALSLLLFNLFKPSFAADYPITSWLGIEQGLSNNSVRCIYQDKKGFLWFGTYDGLNRYDAYTFKVFRNNFNNTSSLPNNFINAIDEDNNGNIWVATRQGVAVYHPLANNFTPIYYKAGNNTPVKLTSVIRDIERDGNGNMLIGTIDMGVVFCAAGDSVGVRLATDAQAAGENLEIASIKKGADKTVWVFIRGKGLYRFDDTVKRLRLVNATTTNASCLEIKEDNIWVGSSRGMYRYNIKQNIYDKYYNEQNGLSQNDVVSVTASGNNKLWIATNAGITVMDITKDQELQYLQAGRQRNSLNSNTITSILEDRDGRMWIGSLRGGINIIDNKKHLFGKVDADPLAANTLISNFVYTFYEEPDGKLWIGTDGNGLSIWDRKANTFRNYQHNPADANSLNNDYITHITGDYQNNIWIATYRGGGVSRYNRAADNFEHFRFVQTSPYREFVNGLTYTLLEDKRKRLWSGTLQYGLFLLNRQTNRFELFDEKLKDLFLLSEDNKGLLWGGSLSQLIAIDTINKQHRFYNIGNPVRSLLEDKAGNFWVGTEGGGLLLFDRKSGAIVTRYTTDDGLCSNSVLNILDDKLGNLWISTFNGISKFNIKDRAFTNYYQNDGLQSNQFNYNAAIALQTGELVFGGIKGFNIFYPANIVEQKHTRAILFTDIRINNTPIEQENSVIEKSTGNSIEVIKVPFDKAILSFEFASLEYSAPDKMQYAYFLEGWDRGWNYANNARTAAYTHLSEGSYTLRVKSTSTPGKWEGSELQLKIIVLPPWYRSVWAYILYVVVAGAIVYIYNRYRIKQTRLQYEVKITNLKLEKEKADREREHVQQEADRMLNEKKITYFTTIAHEFRTPLTLIINPLKDLFNKRVEAQSKPDSELGIVYRNARRMLSLADQLLLFRKAESGMDTIKPTKLNLHHLAWDVYLCFVQQARLQNISYTFTCANETLEIYADREKLEIIIYNLLSNAFKYTPVNGAIAFTVIEQEGNILITIADTGAGIPNQTGDKLFEQFYQAERTITGSKAGFGIGLFLVKHFTDQHKGKITYNSEEGKGATFFLSLLKGADHFAGIPITEVNESGPVFLQALKHDPVVEEVKPEEDKLPVADVVTDKQTILLIDDDEQIRNYLAQLFKDTYIIHQAASGVEGLKAAQTWLPDCIISDVHMQEMNGIELCKQIKENESLNHIPVILLTASTSDDIKLKGVEGGADDYITKPFDNKLLQARITSLLKSRNTLQRYFYNEITLNKNNQRISQEYKEFLEKCIAIVESHLDDESFSVKTLMAEMGMSHSNLFRKVKSVSGQSVNIFIRFIRLRKAAEMFINTNYNVNETAVMVGINDIKYFREQFNKLFGMNPSEYIRRYRKVHGKGYTVDSKLKE
ncbi:signal transduction histidine kinase/ligand-binding sensor domain-containing protein/DNA-binding response OmpR family regulator [Chitinophagaceae bacterium OAS944]|uniref:hybrid sensor histidine kinase/response regulator n=1 Tax=Niastella sp. OAS944 TaxID=2664089 RepID=UPI0035C7F2CF|nr:signal transduction histidine kinase/ligand-binding sensor domain-containing protein/DNA-binding response OmpR family regulator [Chitinophagaceae bacterium OAS944]